MNEHMNILICDDKQNEAERLSNLLKDMGYGSAVFTSGADALEYIRAGAVADVCILDIVMPEMSGIELARLLRDAGFNGEIIFLSASGDYGPQTYDVKAFHYLLKPPAPDSVRRVLDEIKTRREKSDADGIKIKLPGAARFVLFRDIEYAEVIAHKIHFRLQNGGNIEIRSVFSEVAPQLLRDGRFVQCHQSYIVNMDAIASIRSREITMRGGAKIPVSKSYADTKTKYLNRSLGGERG